jgi:hypothetical protein
MSQTPADSKRLTADSHPATISYVSRLLSLVVRHDALAFVIVVAVGTYHFALGVWDLGLFLLGLGGLQLLVVALYVSHFRVSSASPAAAVSIWGRRNLDLVAGRNLTLACGILSLAGGIFFLAKGQTPPYYGTYSGLEIQWSGLMMGLILGPVAILAYGFQHMGRHFTFSLLCTIAVTFSVFYIIGYLGGLVGVLAAVFVIMSKDEFLS